MGAILRTYIRAGKLCPDFFFHEQLARLYAGKKKQKAVSDVSVFLYERNNHCEQFSSSNSSTL
ncbi:hypothetical protein LJC35_00695 [Parabacteroides sp. OttesenSCG-928-N08]|nr:hypothetical protein [Parabacteroides sp. OttesenSCG-928-N08]